MGIGRVFVAEQVEGLLQTGGCLGKGRLLELQQHRGQVGIDRGPFAGGVLGPGHRSRGLTAVS